MSSNSVSLNTNTTIQDLAQTILQEFDVNQDGQLTYSEFANFLDSFVQSLTGQATQTAASGTTVAGTTSSLLSTTTTASSSTQYRDRMLGFDFSRFDSAQGTLKYDAANIMQGINPNDPNAMQTAYDELVKLHPGEVSLDADGNLMLNGTADGYIGIRPLDRSEDWSNPPSGYVWQWMAYNAAHPGPNGEGLS